MCFKNDDRGMSVLNWWRSVCLEWCYARIEDGKFGDQKYLDDWVTRFKGVHELQHIGGGVAPWNLQQYKFKLIEDKIYLKETNNANYTPLVFFHFHGLNFFLENIIQIAPSYYLKNKTIKYIYTPYIKLLQHFKEQVEAIDNSFDANAAKQKSDKKYYTLRDKLSLYKTPILRFNFKEILAVYKKINSRNYFKLNNIIYGILYRS
jgi:hypothetical protein